MWVGLTLQSLKRVDLVDGGEFFVVQHWQDASGTRRNFFAGIIPASIRASGRATAPGLARLLVMRPDSGSRDGVPHGAERHQQEWDETWFAVGVYFIRHQNDSERDGQDR